MIFVVTTFNVQAAFNIWGELDGNGMKWRNVSMSGSDMVPSMWQTPPVLRSTFEWTPGTFSSPPVSHVVFSGAGGSSVSVPIAILGTEYNTVGLSYTTSSSSIGRGCYKDTVSPPLITLKGSSCISSTKLVSSIPVNPFIFLRPIFNLEQSDITRAFDGLPEGTYSGMVPLNFQYYYNDNDILTFRNINDFMIVSIHYRPSIIQTIDVIGDGDMEPVYDTGLLRISGQTTYTINVHGSFSEGVELTLPSKTYALNSEMDASVSIPYQVTCLGCDSTNLVDSGGVLREQTSRIGEGAGEQTTLSFDLHFEYDVEGVELLSGSYTDTVVIMVSLGV